MIQWTLVEKETRREILDGKCWPQCKTLFAATRVLYGMCDNKIITPPQRRGLINSAEFRGPTSERELAIDSALPQRAPKRWGRSCPDVELGIESGDHRRQGRHVFSG